ncbi:MBL fold metallo-hydrolase [Oceanobacillus iheyensis]|uniref:MBL fold metallo-hydrolase n=1 Tax=Oceanobacillus iheyensis TaxID=182710 RepID=UPI003639DFCB
MKVNILASGSNGNCIALTSGESTILIDAGIAKTKIEKKLLEVGITPNKIEAMFITHAHKDHTKGLPLANKYKIPVFAGEDEWKSITGVDEELQNKAPAVFNNGMEYTWEVKAFKTHHDAYDPRGYVVYDLQEVIRCSICLDTGKVEQDMIEAMKDSDIYIIESNHEPRMVEASNYPISVKTRVLSHVGHLSNQQTAAALAELIQGKGEQIYLTHLSSSNNMAMLAQMTTEKALMAKGFIKDKHYRLEVV